MPEGQINPKDEQYDGTDLRILGRYWTFCANCKEWNWCDTFPFTVIPICRSCFDELLKVKGIVKKLSRAFFSNIVSDPKLPTKENIKELKKG